MSLNYPRTFWKQLQILRRVIVLAWMPPALVIAGVFLARLQWNIPVLDLTGDPIMLTNSPLYLGSVSYLGVLLWCATAVVNLFAAHLLPSSAARPYLLGSGALSLLLCFDDLYLIHEAVFPNVLGLPQNFVLMFYGGITLGLLWRHRQVIWQAEYSLLGLALAMFSVSVAVDVAVTGPRKFYLVEDGAKLMGVTMWLVFHARMSVDAVRVSPRAS